MYMNRNPICISIAMQKMPFHMLKDGFSRYNRYKVKQTEIIYYEIKDCGSAW